MTNNQTALMKMSFSVMLVLLTGACANTESMRTVCSLETPQQCMNLCNVGNAQACYITGVGFHKNPEMRNDIKSVAAYTRGCELGSLESCGNLGLMNENGWGTEKNLQRAIELYEQVCAAGIPVHCRNVGRLNEGDSGFPADLERAEAAYRRALELALMQCGSGTPESCAVAGHMYKDGKGVEKSQVRARELLKRSCDMGYSWACKSL